MTNQSRDGTITFTSEKDKFSRKKYQDWDAFLAGIRLMDKGNWLVGNEFVPREKITLDHIIQQLIQHDLMD